jgi:hypothetical protein
VILRFDWQFLNLNYLDRDTAFDYGVFVDDVPVALGPSPTQRYTQTQLSTSLVGRAGVSLGTGAPTPVAPLSIPITMPPAATALQLKFRNITSALNAYTAAATPTAFTTVGSNAYTSPVGSVGVLAYVWGGGGGPFSSNAGGPGGFSFGYYPAAAGTAFTVIVGGLGTNTFLSGWGGAGGSGTAGGGGGFSGLFLGSSPTATVSTPLVIAGGGGGCFLAAGAGFRWVGGGGGGLVGTAAFNLSTQAFSVSGTGNAGTQTASGWNAPVRWGGSSYSSAGAGGGGYFGGGGLLTNGAGGGGSGYVDAAVARPFRALARTATTEISSGAGSNVTAPESGVMTEFGYAPTTYGHGGGGQGLVLLLPVTATTAPQIGVEARFSSA